MTREFCGGPLLFHGRRGLEEATHCPTLEKPGTLLSGAQVARLLSAVNDPGIYAQRPVPCWEPTRGVVFYDAHDKPVAFLSICFECNRLEGFPSIRAQAGSPFFSDEGAEKVSEIVRDFLPK